MAVSSVTESASQIQTDYLKLLVTQLQNQNPLEPLNNNEMASQLAQLSQLGQIESLNSKFSDVLSTAERSSASSLVGKKVAFSNTTGSGSTETLTGTVSEVQESDGDISLLVGGYKVGLSDLLAVGGTAE